MKDFIQNLKKRTQAYVLLAYLAFAWMILQVADVTFPILGLSESALRVAFGLLILGLPVVLGYAHYTDRQPVSRSQGDGARNNNTDDSRTHRLYYSLIIIFVAIACAALLIRLVMVGDVPNQREEVRDEPWIDECSGFVSESVAIVIERAAALTAPGKYFEGRCVPKPGWVMTATGGLRTDKTTGSNYIEGLLSSDGVLGRVYVTNSQANVMNGDRLMVFGVVSRFRTARMGRNPRTGETIEVPTAIYLIGAYSLDSNRDHTAGRRKPPTVQELDDHVLKLVSLHFGKPLREITGNEEFAQDFERDPNPIPGVGDVRLIELVLALEETMPCDIPDDAIDDTLTVDGLRIMSARYCDTR